MAISLAVGALVQTACGAQGAAVATADGDDICGLAEALGELRGDLPPIPDCSGRDALCRARCLLGEGVACLSMAYELEKDPETRDGAGASYRRACLLGVANACTNLAATVWARAHSPSELACARVVFDRSCEARESFACGMVGRLALEQATDSEDFARTREHLEDSCADVGGFPCRVLAKHLESGDLGAYEPGLIPSLLRQACDGGDPDACGSPDSAAETFH